MVKNAVCPGEWCLAVCSIPQKTVTVSGAAWSIGWVYSAGKKNIARHRTILRHTSGIQRKHLPLDSTLLVE
jgi:hypothetical protein